MPFLDVLLSLVHRTQLILHILIVLYISHDLVMVSFKFCISNYLKVNKLKLIRSQKVKKFTEVEHAVHSVTVLNVS